MKDLHRKALGGLLNLVVCEALLIFLPAWTLDYWQGWVCLTVFYLSAAGITLYLMKKDPKLLERRVNAGVMAEKQKRQKIIQIFASAAFIATFAVPALDRRYAWSAVPLLAVIAGDMLIALGFLIVFFVFKVNTFTSGIIEIAEGQRVISTGPYAQVRHPMYAGALVMLFGIPLALGSWWGLFTIVPMTIMIVLRLLDEERFLANKLPGYPEYQGVVRYRLAPWVW